MTIYQTIQEKLESHPDFRERRFRGKYLMILTLRDLDLENKYNEGVPLSLENLLDVSKKYDSYRHEYDAVLRDNPELRGTDYPDKTKLEQQKQQEFGYSPGHYQDLRLGKRL